jgi:hypothetical protein
MANKEYTISFKIDGLEKANKVMDEAMLSSMKLNGELKQNNKQLEGLGKEAEVFNKKDLSGNLDKSSSSFSGFAKAGLVAGAAIAAFGVAVANGIKEAIEADKEVTKLNATLRVSGQYSQQTSDNIQAWADALEKQTVISAEAILSNTSYAISLGYSADQAQRLTDVAINLSAATGGSLETSTNQLIGTLDGTGGKLNTLIKGFSDLTKEQLINGQGIDFLEKKLKGLAETNANSVAGSLAKVKIQFDDIFKDFGTQIISTEDFRIGLQQLGTAVSEFASVARDTAPAAISVMTASLRELAGMLKAVNSYLGLDKEKQLITIYNDQDKALNAKMKTYNSMLQVQAKLNQKAQELHEAGKPGEALAPERTLQYMNERLRLLNLEIEAEKKLKAQRDGTYVEESPTPPPRKGAGNIKGTGTTGTAEDEKEKQRQALILQTRQSTTQAILQNQLEEYTLLDELEQAQFEKGKEFNAFKFESDIAMYGEQNAIKFQIEEQRIGQIQDLEIRRLELEKLSSDKAVAIKKKEMEDKKKLQQMNLQDTQMMLGLMTTLMQSESVELFEIGKMAAVAQATMSMWESVSTSFAFGSRVGGPILGGVFAAAAGVAQAVRIKQIMAQKPPKKNALGGVVDYGQPGNDTTYSRVNKNEVILNPMQQARTLFSIANGGGISSSANMGILSDIRDILATRDNSVYLDGQPITKRVNELNERRLG